METPQRHQIIFIDGGWAFETRKEYLAFLTEWEHDPYSHFPSWKKWLIDGLSDRFESFRTEMPSKFNADYIEWKIWFEKLFPYLNDQKSVIVGHSLGAIFIAKYLSENTCPKQIEQLHLVGPVLDNEGLVGESVASFGFNTDQLSRIVPQCREIHLWSSIDDPVVPYSHAERYHKLIPGSVLHTFSDRGHFFGQPSFVELFLEIQKMV